MTALHHQQTAPRARCGAHRNGQVVNEATCREECPAQVAIAWISESTMEERPGLRANEQTCARDRDQQGECLRKLIRLQDIA